jgi:hypothetical protein
MSTKSTIRLPLSQNPKAKMAIVCHEGCFDLVAKTAFIELPLNLCPAFSLTNTIGNNYEVFFQSNAKTIK